MHATSSDNRCNDRAAIHDAIHRWARAVDRRDWSLIPSVFHPDAYDDHGMYKGGVDGLLEWLKERHESIARSMHCICNLWIEFAGADRALCETYVIAFQQYRSDGPGGLKHIQAALGAELAGSDGTIDILMPARYVDHFEQRSGEWKIVKRVTVFEGRFLLSNAEGTGLDPNWTTGRRDRGDASFVMLAALGALAPDPSGSGSRAK